MNTQNNTVVKLAETALLAALCYVSFTFLQIKIPEPLYSTFDGIGALTMPLSMIIIGCSLAGCDEDHVTYDGPNYVMFSDT